MSPEQFCYWLQGFAELTDEDLPTVDQWQQIRDHLNTVFNKVTPPKAGGGNKPRQVLNEKTLTLEEIERMKNVVTGVTCSHSVRYC